MLLLLLLLCCSTATPQERSQSWGAEPPCQKAADNREERECFASAQKTITDQIDAFTKNVVITFDKEARDGSAGSVATEELRKAAQGVRDSQRTWEKYRQVHCTAVMHSWTTGSGAGTAYEPCMFKVAASRLQELRFDFGNWVSK
jgi:uncharacterized protein YecT (DUF1311 family)